ncbi:tRNA synthetases class I, catalytic domain-domain-containing protein [Leucosporidium creatinivorum]|uniref:glutamate--tRNA ligase n=1 Tax=Leucosporidium creatinivorum TaxID=106004 RepID=A0A1Y2FR25_9BASI|nr:tRNA synthetases class I, catalytic domain-domain-containing protein [Leucosporidium creatinivorum]
MATLSLIANPGRAAAPPLGPLAYAYSLPSPDQLQIAFVHALPEGAGAAMVEIDGKQTLGATESLQALANAFAAEGAYGSSQNQSAQITSHLLLLPAHPPSLPASLPFLATLEQRLTLRTYLISPSSAPSVADFASWAWLRSNPVAQGQLPKLPHTARWFAHMSARAECVKAVETMNVQSKIKAPKQTAAAKIASGEGPSANATFELGLPNAVKGHVVTRLPPEPSGYLHIGHAKAAILNQYFARMYEGKFLIRFDDTNPSKEKAEFEESIIEDLALLGVKADSTSYTSDYFDQLHIFCVQLIKQGDAYADDTEQELMRDQRMNGNPSARRDSSVEDNLTRFAEMATGSEEGKRWCIRAKISVDDPNKAMRDPVVFRCNALPHHRTGTTYKMYPTYDFCCPIVDSIEGVTHALRTNEYRDRNPQYQWMLTKLGLRKVDVWDFGRLGFVHTLLSKRKLKWFVEEGHVTGWDDPRFATVRGIRRRGMTIEALTQFMLLQGPSQAFTNLEWDIIWNINKKVIDPVAPRHVALEKGALVKVLISGEGTPSSPEGREMPKHKKNPEVGTKTTYFSDVIYVEQEDAKSFAQDEEITLMDWGNAFVRSITTSPSGITELSMELNLDGDFKKTKKKVTWLSSSSPSTPLTPVTLLDYDYLITKKKLEEDDDVKNFLTPQTEFRVDAVADLNVAGLKKGEIIQFERKGYYIVDKAFDASTSAPAELILIPDGKASSIVSKYVAAQEAAAKASGAAKAAAAPPKAPSKKAQAKAAKAAAAGGAAPAAEKVAARIPEPAPLEAVQTTLLSDVKRGYEIPVNTKMFRVPSVYGEDGVEAPAKTDMFKVKPVYEI